MMKYCALKPSALEHWSRELKARRGARVDLQVAAGVVEAA